MELACASPMIPGATLTEQAEHLRAWGYDAISVFQPYDAWDDAVRRELLALADRTGVRPIEFVLIDDVYGKAMSEDRDLRERCRTMYRQAAEVCAEIGAVTEIEYEYGAQDPLPLFDPFQQLDAAQAEAFTAWYRELLGEVEGSAGAVLLEPLNRYESRYLNRVEDNLRVLDAVDHPNAGLLPDVFHMSIEEGDVPAALRAGGERIRQVHLGDTNRTLPGHGFLDWPGIADALRSVGYDATLTLECSTEGDPATTLPRTAAFLRELLQR